MNPYKTRAERDIQGKFLGNFKSLTIAAAFILLSLNSCVAPYVVSQYPGSGYPDAPSWAQNYDSGNPVNYYYLPDLECYYDLRQREFVYLENGNWRFSASLPSIFGSYDLNNCFVVKLNNAVHEPWMHFQYYVAHYPRYFYRSVDRDGFREGDRNKHWFNENDRYSGQRYSRENNGRNNERAIQGVVRNVPEHRDQNSGYQQRQPMRNEGSVNREQPMKYYGRQIGQPVKVQRNMKKPKEEQRSKRREDRKGRD